MDKKEEELLRVQRRFLAETERDIRAANLEIIHAEIPALNRQCFFDLGRHVARKRAAYLRKAIELSRLPAESTEHAAALKDITGLRVAYEESRDAFAALERAIERGYIDVASP